MGRVEGIGMCLRWDQIERSGIALIWYRKVSIMSIQIQDAALEARIQRQLEATGAGSVEETLLHLLETQEEQDRWLIESREAIAAQIRRGCEELDRGEGIPEDKLDDYLARLKAATE